MNVLAGMYQSEESSSMVLDERRTRVQLAIAFALLIVVDYDSYS